MRNVKPLHVHPAWRKVVGGGSFAAETHRHLASAAVDVEHGRVALGPGNGWFYCFDAQSGEPLWKDEIAGAAGRAILDDGRILVGTVDGLLIAYDEFPKTAPIPRSQVLLGQRLWSYRIAGAIQKAPVVDGDRVLFVDGQNAVYALDRKTGAWRWQYRRKAPDDFSLNGESSVLVSDGRAYVGFSDGHLVALDAASGTLIWDRDLAPEHHKFQDIDATPVLLNKQLFAASMASGLHALDPESGELRWNLPISGISSMAVADDDLVLSLEDSICRVDGHDGRMKWRTSFGDAGAPSEPIIGQGVIAVSVSQDGLHILDAESGHPLVRFNPGSGMSAAPSMGSDGSIYVLSNGGVFYAFRPPESSD